MDPNPAYLIRGDCLYADYGETGWDPRTHQLTADFRKALDVGYASPDFCFPLAVRKKWGPHGLPEWGMIPPEEAKDWEVVGVKARDPSAPGGQKTFHVTSTSGYPGAGITVDIWFTKGVGVIREGAIHHGTIGEERIRLLRFEPARSGSPLHLAGTSLPTRTLARLAVPCLWALGSSLVVSGRSRRD